MPSDTEKTQAEPASIEGWTHLLCDQEMPIFSNTAQKIYKTLSDSNKGAIELASDILQDPNLTTKVLKMSNSSFYNPSRQSMSTVSRAIVILGSEVIRELTLVCSFFESILSTDNKDKANAEIGRALHAAVQAKAIAIAVNDKSPEEVFIAALLKNIGNIAFWCFCDKQGERLHALTKNGQYSDAEAEKQVLGFHLTDLSASLSKTWHLGGLIEDTIKNPDSSDRRTQYIHLALEITEAVKEGWDGEKMQQCIDQVSTLTGQPKPAIKQQLQQNTETARKIARQLGAHDASRFISKPPIQSKDADPEVDELPSPEASTGKQLQFHILQDITAIMSGKIDINQLFETVLEGIHRGVSMDRTFFALLSPDKKNLKEKYSFGWHKDINEQKACFHLTALPANLFFQALHQTEGLWAKPSSHSFLYSPQVLNMLGRHECFLIPVITNDKPIGLIYCDRAINHQPLTPEDVKAVKHFAQQANIGLAMYRLINTT